MAVRVRVEAKMDSVSKALQQHYAAKFSLHGPSSEGVDWGADESKLLLRYDKMLHVVNHAGAHQQPSLLDVGCGYGGLQRYAAGKNIALDYTGIDVAANMIEWARANLPAGNFIHGDILAYDFDRKFDYVVCNGILTQKLEIAGLQMDQFAAQLIRQMFSLCRVGVAFNVMTTKVNYYANNLYYRNPAELFAW
ncbi:MAG TPA: class I SAM-dependent methyltransferase, partial [Pyrinomonadaceae bacterium]|nr:class I SAM-dependent methyltransferase [Pyrinomonadaceae bacterium]